MARTATTKTAPEIPPPPSRQRRRWNREKEPHQDLQKDVISIHFDTIKLPLAFTYLDSIHVP
ncbi:1211_t:CDS:2 [Acaulospora morrowiae]|uniref:1211_t:CDS:1 n=1 Tax=Acaulospora morrowiae TaxID=94023 RepID=A0A9N9ND13_9GLOM|nr:1211_t:CDS:2 [Acaulospora morrowiae]